LSKLLGPRVIKRAVEYTYDKLHASAGLQRIKNMPICWLAHTVLFFHTLASNKNSEGVFLYAII
jgi:hypothetical protein